MKPDDVTDEMKIRSPEQHDMQCYYCGGWTDFDKFSSTGCDHCCEYRWCKKKAGNSASVNAVGQQKLRLPRVELKDLVPGRWYMAIHNGSQQCLRSFHGDGVALLPGLHRLLAIYGPLPEFELEET